MFRKLFGTAAVLVIVLATGAQATTFEFGGHSYLLTSSAMPWNMAELEAVNLGGHLVAVNSSAEHEFLISSFNMGSIYPFPLWIGLSDSVSEGTFVWSSGEPVTFTAWAEGEPNNNQYFFSDATTYTFLPEGEDFVAMNWDTAAYDDFDDIGSWNDTPQAGTFVSYTFGPRSLGPYFGIIELPTTTTPVPEPASAFLLGSGIATLAAVKRNRAKRARQ